MEHQQKPGRRRPRSAGPSAGQPVEAEVMDGRSRSLGRRPVAAKGEHLASGTLVVPSDRVGRGPRSQSMPGERKGKGKGKDKGNGKGSNARSSSQPAPKRRSRSTSRTRQSLGISWDNPEGAPLSNLVIGAEVEGVVSNVCTYGVFVDIGAERNARLNVPFRTGKQFKRGDHLQNCVIDRVDPELGRMNVSLEDLDATLEANRMPLENLQEGIRVDGVVTNKGPWGVFVNIGAERDGRLDVPRAIGIRFLRGQVLKDLALEHVDLDLRRITLTSDDPEAAAADLVLVGMPALDRQDCLQDATPQARQLQRPPPAKLIEESASSQPRPRARPAATKPAILDDPVGCRIGDLVDGVVTSIAHRGVIVDIGLEKSGILEVSAQLKQQFQKGDQVHGMLVERSLSGVAVLSMEDPELEVGDEEYTDTKGAKGKGRKGSKGRKSASRERKGGKGEGKKGLSGAMTW